MSTRRSSTRVLRRIALCWCLVASACSDAKTASSPEGTVKEVIAATRVADRVGVYQRLGPATRARIEALGASARKMTGRVAMLPEDFLSVGWAPPAWEAAGMRTLHRDEKTAEVEVYSAAGDRHSVTMVLEDKSWKIELPGR